MMLRKGSSDLLDSARKNRVVNRKGLHSKFYLKTSGHTNREKDQTLPALTSSVRHSVPLTSAASQFPSTFFGAMHNEDILHSEIPYQKLIADRFPANTLAQTVTLPVGHSQATPSTSNIKRRRRPYFRLFDRLLLNPIHAWKRRRQFPLKLIIHATLAFLIASQTLIFSHQETAHLRITLKNLHLIFFEDDLASSIQRKIGFHSPAAFESAFTQVLDRYFTLNDHTVNVYDTFSPNEAPLHVLFKNGSESRVNFRRDFTNDPLFSQLLRSVRLIEQVVLRVGLKDIYAGPFWTSCFYIEAQPTFDYSRGGLITAFLGWTVLECEDSVGKLNAPFLVLHSTAILLCLLSLLLLARSVIRSVFDVYRIRRVAQSLFFKNVQPSPLAAAADTSDLLLSRTAKDHRMRTLKSCSPSSSLTCLPLDRKSPSVSNSTSPSRKSDFSIYYRNNNSNALLCYVKGESLPSPFGSKHGDDSSRYISSSSFGYHWVPDAALCPNQSTASLQQHYGEVHGQGPAKTCPFNLCKHIRATKQHQSSEADRTNTDREADYEVAASSQSSIRPPYFYKIENVQIASSSTRSRDSCRASRIGTQRSAIVEPQCQRGPREHSSNRVLCDPHLKHLLNNIRGKNYNDGDGEHLQHQHQISMWKSLSWCQACQLLNWWSFISLISNIFHLAATVWCFVPLCDVNNRLFALGIACFFTWINLLRYLDSKDTPSLYILVRTLKRGLPRVGEFLVSVIPLFFGFCALGMSMFWPLNDFANLSDSSKTLFSVLNGDEIHNIFNKIGPLYPLMSQIYLYSFTCIFICVILNVFISIIDEAFFSEQQRASEDSSYLMSQYKKSSDKNTEREHQPSSLPLERSTSSCVMFPPQLNESTWLASCKNSWISKAADSVYPCGPSHQGGFHSQQWVPDSENTSSRDRGRFHHCDPNRTHIVIDHSHQRVPAASPNYFRNRHVPHYEQNKADGSLTIWQPEVLDEEDVQEDQHQLDAIRMNQRHYDNSAASDVFVDPHVIHLIKEHDARDCSNSDYHNQDYHQSVNEDETVSVREKHRCKRRQHPICGYLRCEQPVALPNPSFPSHRQKYQVPSPIPVSGSLFPSVFHMSHQHISESNFRSSHCATLVDRIPCPEPHPSWLAELGRKGHEHREIQRKPPRTRPRIQRSQTYHSSLIEPWKFNRGVPPRDHKLIQFSNKNSHNPKAEGTKATSGSFSFSKE